jgi:hypothetical protein
MPGLVPHPGYQPEEPRDRPERVPPVRRKRELDPLWIPEEQFSAALGSFPHARAFLASYERDYKAGELDPLDRKMVERIRARYRGAPEDLHKAQSNQGYKADLATIDFKHAFRQWQRAQAKVRSSQENVAYWQREGPEFRDHLSRAREWHRQAVEDAQKAMVAAQGHAQRALALRPATPTPPRYDDRVVAQAGMPLDPIQPVPNRAPQAIQQTTQPLLDVAHSSGLMQLLKARHRQ